MREKNYSTWALWALIVLLPAVAIAVSTYHVFPDSFKIVGILIAISVGVSAWIVQNSDEPVRAIKRFGLLVKFALAVVMFANLAVHVQVSRELSGALSARAERHEEEDRADQRAQKAAQREKELMEARANETRATAEAFDKQRRLLVQLPTAQRRYVPPVASKIPPVEPSAESAPALPGDKPKTMKADPDDIRQAWAPWMFWFAFAEALIAVVGGARLLVLRHWDADGNGIPDWIEQLPAEERARRFPQYEREGQRQTPGFAPATAQGGNYYRYSPEGQLLEHREGVTVDEARNLAIQAAVREALERHAAKEQASPNSPANRN